MDEANIVNYKNHLKRAFRHISTNKKIQRECGEIGQFSNNIYGLLDESRDDEWSFGINPPWIIPIEKDRRNFDQGEAKLMLSGLMHVENHEFTMYSFVSSIIINARENPGAITSIPLEELSECNHVYTDRLIRRFHFDLATGEDKKNKPISHFQFGGNDRFYTAPNYFLNKKYGLPRVPYPPIDFIIMFDMIVRQFKTKIDGRFYNDSSWVKIVQKSEDYRLRDYYRKIFTYFEKRPRIPLVRQMCDEEIFFC